MYFTRDSDDRIEVGGNGELELGHNNSDFTISLTINLDEDHDGQWRNIFHKGETDNSGADRTPALWLNPNKQYFAL